MIQIKNLTKKFGNTTILKDASYSFRDTGIVCLLGASGCGKSTLLNILAGFDSDYTGEIIVGNTPIHKMNSDTLSNYRRDNIGFIFQNYHLLSGYTVSENITLPCELVSTDTISNISKAKELLCNLNLSEKETEKTQNLSGGQRQRVAIARALISNPNIILADEPTGALDRANSTQIMTLLKEISKDKLVIIITHDKKICEFADDVISIQEGKIISQGDHANVEVSSRSLSKNTTQTKINTFARGLKNFKVHLSRYASISLAISLGVICFILSLSSGNIMEHSIDDFKEKNTAFNNGYIKKQDKDSTYKLLTSDERIENVYYQYKINDITLSMGDKSETMAEKYPMPKALESMSYGTMPKIGKSEISLSPSLAKKFDSAINNLIGKEVVLSYNGNTYNLNISGIFNASYDDFFVSSDIEKQFYDGKDNSEYYSISYDVSDFNDIVFVNNMLEDEKIISINSAKEVNTLQITFQTISRLFLIVSILILLIALFISIIMLVKLQQSRYKEIGLLLALGFNTATMRKIIITENILLSVMSAVFNAILIGCAYFTTSIFNLPLSIELSQAILSIISTGFIVVIISIIASHKLIHTEPAVALRK